ncbi:hypothetical protein [Arthrobacter sp. Z4-13]
MSGNRKTTNNKKPLAPPLASEQYSELNATFYSSAGPTEYVRARLQSIIFTLSDGDEAADILKKGVQYGALQGGAAARMPQESRLRYAFLDSTVLVHHAGESLMRLWLAHMNFPLCPWVKVASVTQPGDFKRQAAKFAEPDTSHVDRKTVASMFLGGETAEDAGVEMNQETWENSIEGIIELLRVVAHRLTNENALYNAAKHGLVGIPGDQGAIRWNDHRVAGGPGITYLESRRDGKSNPPQFSMWVTSTFTSLEGNLLLIELIIRATHSLWSVARRKYIGLPGDLVLVSRDEVYATVAIGPIRDKRHLVDWSQKLPTYTYETGQRKISNAEFHTNAIGLGDDVLEASDRLNGRPAEPAFVDLPLRAEDERTPSKSTRSLFSFSPAGSSSV